ncbi:MAG TPA: hypothetical protein VF109_07990, partial [Mycobacteriales bacterium]
MGFDPEEYRKEVLDPARRRGNVPPADLFVRYAIGPEARRDDAAFAAHVEGMAKHWRALKQKQLYAKLAHALLAGHAELAGAGELTRAGFDQRLLAERTRAAGRFEQLVRALAEGSPCISRSRLAALLDAVGGLLDERSVTEVLRRHKLEVIERPWELPAVPAGNKHKDLAANLSVLNLRLSTELVLGTEAVRRGFRLRGGFRLVSGTGAALSEADIQRIRASLAERAQDERKTAKENVLAILLGAVRVPQGLEALLVWEVAEILRPLVANRVPVRAVADEAAQLGLDRRDAIELAVALVEAAGTGRTGPDPEVAAVRDAMAAGELRAAQRLAALLPAGTEPDLTRQVEVEAGRVRAIVERAEHALAGGQSEAAAELLAAAVAAATDDEPLRRRLEAIPPPAAARVWARVDGERATVGWAPSPVRTGQPRYRVVRSPDGPARAAGHGVPVADTEQDEVVDTAPPVGEEIFYTVFATRGGLVWSEPASAAPVLITPEVADPEVVCDPDSVTGSWRVPAGVADVQVVRGDGKPPTVDSDGHRVAATTAGFVDAAVREGTHYYY